MTAAERLAVRFSMADRRALITGGSMSIGRAIAEAFADAGAQLAMQCCGAADAGLDLADSAATMQAALAARGAAVALIEADFAEPGAGTRVVGRPTIGARVVGLRRVGGPELADDVIGGAARACDGCGRCWTTASRCTGRSCAALG